MKIGIGLKCHSYTPEAYAYSQYLTKNGFTTQLDDENNLDDSNDINIHFLGLRPFWKKKSGKVVEIHEYQSLSTGAFPKSKDLIKRIVNKKPVGRIFLNNVVKDHIGFRDDVPNICRDMGVDSALFQRPSLNPSFDIVYSGSISGRIGLIDELIRLANLDLRILIVGDVSDDVRTLFSPYKKVHFSGRVKRENLPELYRQCRAGLNYTPDMYPFNIQTSTKTLEYLASGLHVLSNRYVWSLNFFSDKLGVVTWLEEFHGDFKFQNQKHQILDMSNYAWERILDDSNFIDFLKASI